VALGRVLALIYAQHQVSQINLYVNDFNVAALGLYKSLGFTQVGTMSTVLL
jgi:acetyltransferase